MRIFGFFVIAVSLLIVILSCFFGLALPVGLKRLFNMASLTCVLGPALGGCLVAYGSECGTAFKLCPNSEESAIAVGLIYLVLEVFYPEIKAADIEIESRLTKAFL